MGGVEINPISFPSTGDDLGIKSLRWLSDEWIEMLQVAFSEAKRLGMTCDLIVGSGWPFGSETLPPDERAQVALIFAETLEGPMEYEVSRYHIFRETDPGVTDTFPGRTFEILSLKLVPDPMESLNQVIELSDWRDQERFVIKVPEGKHVLRSGESELFCLCHQRCAGCRRSYTKPYGQGSGEKYLNHMSDTIQKRLVRFPTT